MKTCVAFASLAALTIFTAPAFAAAPVQQMLYNVDAASQCTRAAAEGANDLRAALAHCDVALRDPQMNRRAALLVDRGIINARRDDRQAAMADYDAAIALAPETGDAYVNRGALLIAEKQYAAAGADLDQALRLGAANLHVAYYGLGVIADEHGDYRAAYRDYRKALELKPDYAPASRELTRFKVTNS